MKRRFSEYKRIIKIARKPTKEEFQRILKITGAGIILVGAIGFMLQIFIGAIV